ncbi:thioredoxin family protein [Piscinibacter gummiphilus]|uniref:Thioredoxin family protein n=1 Tax=Piscinibacter gummiphilus TaxID=946333 RepID=A0ABZ0CYJ0_9BURK|nr:thioredoxin family protein [Piscinibacter gummiphilus]WOB07559.1 thioredoxin family protein [Piscinibacter gummiphilus]
MPLRLSRRHLLHTLAAAALPVRAGGSNSQLPDLGAAPEFAGIERWLNSEPLTMRGLRGRVVLVDFWTFGCINCQRTMPYVNAWAERYTPQGLTIVGVHTPEFPLEHPVDKLLSAMKRQGIRHPVAQDNDWATWKAYGNQYWPAFYLVDARGRIRYKRFGEGEYERTEGAIRTLLAQR